MITALGGIITARITLRPVRRKTWGVAHGEQAVNAAPGVIKAFTKRTTSYSPRSDRFETRYGPLTADAANDEARRYRDRRRARLLVERRRSAGL